MTFAEKYDRVITGIVPAILLPFFIGIIIYLFSSGSFDLKEYLGRIAETKIITHAITLCVFPNVFIFLIFNRMDMLKACKGVLAVTIVWALIVFAVKLLV